MKAAYDVGVNFFDCAEGYQDGASEKIMGEAIKKFGWKRNDLVISSKVILHSSLTTTNVVMTDTASTLDQLGFRAW